MNHPIGLSDRAVADSDIRSRLVPSEKCKYGGNLFPYTAIHGSLSVFLFFLCECARWSYLRVFRVRRPVLIMWFRVAGSWWRSGRRFCTMTPMTSSKKALSSKVSFASLTQNNLGTVRKLNSVLFPIKYSEKFYSEILLPEVEDFCKLSM